MARGTESLGDAMLILIHTKREARGFDTPRLILRCDSILIHTKREARGIVVVIHRPLKQHFNPHEARSSWPAQRLCWNRIRQNFNPHEARSSWRNRHILRININAILIHTKREARGIVVVIHRPLKQHFNPHEARSSWRVAPASPTAPQSF